MKNYKNEFKVFFEKHKNITQLPFVLTIVIPKYECKGERVINTFDELLDDEELIKKYLIADYDNIENLYDLIQEDIPNISEKNAFYKFNENNLVIAKYINEEVVFEILDYSDEIFDMY